ncbi:GNAT family N-acetyltransferase [Pseudonocardia phyllosphaerae]|uniref:GNAT family N-acetyltransferase n=1 Tax=Pseudonocardia phyllosphaerae TaxID=3390502 RepID=UPI00397AAED5
MSGSGPVRPSGSGPGRPARPRVGLRRCRPDDATEIAALVALDASVPAGILGDTGPDWHRAAAADPDRLHVVAAGTGREVDGYLVLAAPRGPEPGVELHRLVVAPARRGSGLGRALLDTALTLTGADPGAPCLDTGTTEVPAWLHAGRLWLEVAPDNTAALELYRAAGLVVETQLPSVPGDPSSPVRRLVLSRG